jgi:hypothetical protein
MINDTSDFRLGLTDQLIGIVCDGSDTDGVSSGCVFGGGTDIHNSVMRNLSNGATINNPHVFHDNMIENLVGGADGVAHANGFEFNNESLQNNAVYNNVLRHLFLSGNSGEVKAWQTPNLIDWTFNNVMYDFPNNGNYWDTPNGLVGMTGWTIFMFNNTFIFPVDGTTMTTVAKATKNFINNHCVFPNGGSSTSCVLTGSGTLNQTTNLVQTTATASSQGYVANPANGFAYSPQSGGATIGTGTNESAICAAIQAAAGGTDYALLGAAQACMSDTTYACVYNSATHSVACPNRTVVMRPPAAPWDIGAYQFMAVTPPNQATNLMATPH